MLPVLLVATTFVLEPVMGCMSGHTPALIISGGWTDSREWRNSVEVYVPSTGQHCQLPDIPDRTVTGHNQEGLMACGGMDSTSFFCLTLIDGTWEMTNYLLEDRLILLTYNIITLITDIVPSLSVQ